MVRRTKSEAMETRAEILDAAERVFHRKGVLSATLNDIAKEAGVTRGAIYWHFENKHDVFMAMVERNRLLFDTLSEKAEDPAEPDPLGRLGDFMCTLLRQVVEDQHQRRIFEIMFHKCEFSGENLQLLGKQRDKCRESSARMGRVLSNAVARQQLPATLHIARAVNWLHSQLTGVIMFWLLDPESMDLGHDAEGFVQTCLFSLASAPYLHASSETPSV
ncbi:MAG: TetR family transcriptional regulator [Pseudomonadota bacterium]|nr:TetR family transcriptional regulator [Pseudomonadota bacterium]|tara:strand:+ start:1302 stop:1955 length:654 start_codon:yes stop_codon:yes gene_type:complete